MDSLFWKRLNPNIICDTTKKRYFGRYCYKLVFLAYGGRSITDHDRTIQASLDTRKFMVRQTNWGGSWHSRSTGNLDKANITLLEELRSIKNGYGSNVRVRVEEPWIQVYADDEETLKSIAARFDSSCQKFISVISTPESKEHEDALNRDSILIKPDSKIGYSHKVFLKDGMYTSEIKSQIYNYLLGLGDIVKLTKSANRMLSGPLTYIWGCYFYTNDPNIDIMLNIIRPGTIGKIHKLESI